MKRKVILCVLNRIFLEETDGKLTVPKEESFDSIKLNKKFNGIQANEAPVKSLLQSAHNSGQDVAEIIYLCSNKCTEPSIPVSALEGLSAFQELTDEYISVDKFFIDRIEEFCKQKGILQPVPNPLTYAPSKPADSLQGLNEYFDGTYEVSIDITGGRRDAVILQVLASQLLKLKSSSNSIGDIVYANLDDKTIVNQNSTFGLIDVIDALNSFIRYGRADQLSAYFLEKDFVSEETIDLCKKNGIFF